MSSYIACGVRDPTKNQRRGSMMECARKKKINYYGMQKVDKVISDILSGKSPDKLYTLAEARGRLFGLKGRATKVHGWIVQFKNQENKKEKVAKWKAELEVLKKDYARMAALVESLMKEDKKIQAEIQAIKDKKEKEKKKKEELKKQREEERKKKALEKKQSKKGTKEKKSKKK